MNKNYEDELENEELEDEMANDNRTDDEYTLEEVIHVLTASILIVMVINYVAYLNLGKGDHYGKINKYKNNNKRKYKYKRIN